MSGAEGLAGLDDAGIIRVQWKAPGPVSLAFSNSTDLVAGIVGPVGSGKTTASLVRILKVALAQRPSPIDGVRRCKALVLRNVFTDLQRTVLQSWHSWFPKTMGEWVQGPPATHVLKMAHPRDGGPVHLHVDFMGLGDENIESRLRSYEMTCFYINEADLMQYSDVAFLISRLGRYPSAIHGGPTFTGGWLDFNMPEADHWLIELFKDGVLPGTDGQKAEGFRLFQQPPGALADGTPNPEAENLTNLPKGYYLNQLTSNPSWMNRRMVFVQPGYSRDGKPVYPEFKDELHVAPAPLLPVKGVPIGIGFDNGGTAAAVFGQYLAGGKWRILGEVPSEPGTGPTRFAGKIMEELAAIAPGWTVADCYGWGDPAAAYGGDEEGGDPAWLNIVRREVKIPLKVTGSNNPVLRQKGMRSALTTLIDGEPAFLLSPRCKVLRKGLNSQYRYRKILGVGNAGRFDIKPEKNPYSHPCEALEYLIQGGGLSGLARDAVRGDERRPAMADNDYSVFGD